MFSLLAGEPEYLDPLKDETPDGWIVTGYPWYGIQTPEHKAFLDAYQAKWKDYPRLGSVVGYTAMKSVAAGVEEGQEHRDREAGRGVQGPGDRHAVRPDHATAPTTTSRRWAPTSASTKNEGGKGVMVDWRYLDGAKYLPSDEQESRADEHAAAGADWSDASSTAAAAPMPSRS